nr:MAG TPA: hypothetical protein [Caudoviricetes sp.]
MIKVDQLIFSPVYRNRLLVVYYRPNSLVTKLELEKVFSFLK